MQRIAYDAMQTVFYEILLANGLENNKAVKCAEIFATNSLEGVYTHGVNRFARFIAYIKDGHVVPGAEPIPSHASGSMEQWDGQLGPGPLNALFATDRAMLLAEQNGIGCVALRNTNHWMRGGYYAWQAAKKNCVLIAWTNTIANMPAWGAKDARLGNNPLIIGIPYHSEAIVLDMAMSQFSFGKLEVYSARRQPLPVYGGYDNSGTISYNASDIIASSRLMPTGYWKGAGLSLLLDILAIMLSGGNSVAQISSKAIEAAVSQVFIAIDIKQLQNYPAMSAAVDEIIADYLASVPASENEKVVYPGQRVLQIKEENLAKGIPVDDAIWKSILALK